VRYPLLVLSLAFAGGILLASLLALPLWVWLALAGVALLGLILPRRSPRFAFLRPPPFLARLLPPGLAPWLVLLTLLLGTARYQAAWPVIGPGHIAYANDNGIEMVVEGVLIAPPDGRDGYTNLRLQVERLHPAGSLDFTPVQGLLLARVPPGAPWQYGDRVRLQGRLQTPRQDELFSYRDYLARQGIHSYMPNAEAALLLHDQGSPLMSAIYSLRSRSQAMIYRLYPDPEASLLAGILLGIETGIPAAVQQAFRNTGTSHIIAISGFNITIIAALLAAFFTRLLGRRTGALAAGIGVALYTVLVGADAAVVRAALFGGLTLLGRQFGRRQEGLNSLAFVAALMALFNPFVFWDVSFQLSFAATLGLMLYATPFTEAFTRLASRVLPPQRAERLAGPVGEYFLITLAAQITTLPITIYHFRQISLVSLLANPVILPAQPPVMLLGGLAVLLGLLSPPLGQAAAFAALPFVSFTIRTVEWFDRLPGGVIPLGTSSPLLVLILYGLILLLTVFPRRLPALAARLRPGFALAAVAVLTVAVWRAALSAPDGLLHVTLIDVGTGSAVLIQTPGGQNILVGGGDSATRLSDALGRRLPLSQRRLDWLVIAAPDREGLAALPPMLVRYPPGEVLWAGPTHGTYASRQLWAALTLERVPVTLMETGHTLQLSQGATLRCLNAGPRGAVLLLEWDRFRLLLPDGAVPQELAALHTSPVSALLLAGGGYAPLNPPEWIESLQPQVLLLSVAADDPQGLPSPETLLTAQGLTLLRTDQHGWIHLTTDGQNLWVEVER